MMLQRFFAEQKWTEIEVYKTACIPPTIIKRRTLLSAQTKNELLAGLLFGRQILMYIYIGTISALSNSDVSNNIAQYNFYCT